MQQIIPKLSRWKLQELFSFGVLMSQEFGTGLGVWSYLQISCGTAIGWWSELLQCKLEKVGIGQHTFSHSFSLLRSHFASLSPSPSCALSVASFAFYLPLPTSFLSPHLHLSPSQHSPVAFPWCHHAKLALFSSRKLIEVQITYMMMRGFLASTPDARWTLDCLADWA